MWTDKDRAELKTYMIYIGRKLKHKFTANLVEATKKWDEVCQSYGGDSTVTLYHDARNRDNECCKQSTV